MRPQLTIACLMLMVLGPADAGAQQQRQHNSVPPPQREIPVIQSKTYNNGIVVGHVTHQSNATHSNQQAQVNQQANAAPPHQSSATIKLAPSPSRGNSASFYRDNYPASNQSTIQTSSNHHARNQQTFQDQSNRQSNQTVNNFNPVINQNEQSVDIPLPQGDQLAKSITPPNESQSTLWGGFSSSSMKPLMTTGLSLALVLGLFGLVVWISKKGGPRSTRALPKEVVEVIGVTSITPRQQMQLVRLGNKLLLLSMTQQGVQTIGEVNDADEVARICAICQSSRSGSMTDTFQRVLSQLNNEKSDSGFLGSQVRENESNESARTTAQVSRTLYEA